VEQLRDGPGGALGPVFQGAGAADPEEVLDVVGDAAVEYPGVRAEEARPAAFPVRVVAQPDDGERDDAGQHAGGEQVLDEADRRPVADPRDRERAGEQRAVGLDDRQQQHDEAPERRRVRRPWHRPLQQLALTEHLGQLRLDVGRRVRPGVLEALGGRLARQRQPLQPPQPPPRHRVRDHREPKANDHPHDHARNPLLCSEAYASGRDITRIDFRN
jgi:hypothetical protein